MPSTRNSNAPIELRGAERAFQLDRDTIIVFTGIHPQDIRPFVRIGAGGFTPIGLLRHIENVILPDQDPMNVGLELFWLHSTLQWGGEVIRYIGSKDQISQIYSYSGMRELPESQKAPVELLPYKPLLPAERNSREKCMVNFMETGTLNLAVDGANVLDLNSYRKGILSLDKEYELIGRAMRRRRKLAGEGHGFIYIDETRTHGPSIYMNFSGSGLFVNPPRNFHYRLFEYAIDPAGLKMGLSASPFAPGFVEMLRRANKIGEDRGVFCLNQEKYTELKRLYPNCKLKTFDDSRVLPFAKEVVFFLSRGGSYGLFSIRLNPEVERHVQILFPTGGGKENRKFESIRGPHDLEIAEIHTVKQLQRPAAPDAYMVLHTAGRIPVARYRKGRLDTGFYPLVGGCEYTFQQASQPAEYYEQILSSLEGTEIHGSLKELLLLCMGLDFDHLSVERVLKTLATMKIETGPELLNNIFETLRFIGDLPLVEKEFLPAHKKHLNSLLRKFALRKIGIEQWLELKNDNVEFRILFLHGRKTYLFVFQRPEKAVRLQIPPEIEELEADPKSYRSLLKKQTRLIDKAGDPPGYRESLELMEKFYEERIRLVAERSRFKDLLAKLGIELQAGKKRPIPSFIPAGLENAYLRLDDYILEPVKRFFQKLAA